MAISMAASRLPASASPVPANVSAVPWSTEVRVNGKPRVIFTAPLKPQRFEYWQTLVVVHREVGIGFRADGRDEGAVGGQRALYGEAALAHCLADRRDGIDFLRAQVASLTSVGVEAQYRYGGLTNAKTRHQVGMQYRQGLFEMRLRNGAGYVCER